MRLQAIAIATLALIVNFADGAAQRMALRTGQIRLPAGSQHAARAAAHCVDPQREYPEIADNFNHFSGNISVTRTANGQSETKTINEAIERKWFAVRGTGNESSLEFVPLDSTAEYLIDIPKQNGVPVGGVNAEDVSEYRSRIGDKLDILVSSLDQVADDAAKLHPLLGEISDGLRQKNIWALSQADLGDEVSDVKALKLELRKSLDLPNVTQLPDGVLELLKPKELEGVNPSHLANFLGYQIIKDEKIAADLAMVNALAKEYAEFGGLVERSAASARRSLAEEIIASNPTNAIDAIPEFKRRMRNEMDYPEEIPSEDLLRATFAEEKADSDVGVDHPKLAKALGVRVNPALYAPRDLGELAALRDEAENIHEELGYVADLNVRKVARQALHGEIPEGTTATTVFRQEMRSFLGLEEDAVPSLDVLKLILKGRLGDVAPQAVASFLNLRLVPNPGLETELSGLDTLVRSYAEEVEDIRLFLDRKAAEIALLALHGDLQTNAVKGAFQEEMRSAIGLPELTGVELAEIRILLPDVLAKLPAARLQELFGIPVTEASSRKIVRIDFHESGVRHSGSQSKNFESLEESLKSLTQNEGELPEVVFSEIPGVEDVEILHRHGIFFVKHLSSFRSEMTQMPRQAKIIVVSSLERAKAGKLFETEDGGILDSIQKGTQALQKAADDGADINIVDSREQFGKILEELGQDVRPILVLHNPGDSRIRFEDGDFNLNDCREDTVLLTCDSYRISGLFASHPISTGVLEFERLADSVIKGAKNVDGVAAQDKTLLRAVETGYSTRTKSMGKGVTLAFGSGALGIGIIYGLFGAGGADVGEDPAVDDDEEGASESR